MSDTATYDTASNGLRNKRILLGITGGIAAYKSAELTRLLKTAGAEVRIVLTSAGAEFVTPLTLQALSGNPVHQHLLDPEAEAGMGHIELARWADAIIIAPASADFIARLAGGMGNDLLTTLCLASDAPTVLAPAMNQAMWRDKRTAKNVEKLQQLGMQMLGPAAGEQACGDVGPGRMLEPAEILNGTAAMFASQALAGVKLVITAGPTREAIDPVRYISNHSSGKMGYALAEAAVNAGADVTLISGPVKLPCPEFVNRVNVISAKDMFNASLNTLGHCDIFIAAAAVADYRPATVAEQKIKKQADTLTIELVKNPDIVASIASPSDSQQPPRPFTIGFAAETEHVEDYARGKLQRKNLDMIIANNVADSAIGFNSDDNAVTLISATDQLSLPHMSKTQLARKLIARIANEYVRYQASQPASQGQLD